MFFPHSRELNFRLSPLPEHLFRLRNKRGAATSRFAYKIVLAARLLRDHCGRPPHTARRSPEIKPMKKIHAMLALIAALATTGVSQLHAQTPVHLGIYTAIEVEYPLAIRQEQLARH